jgi:hypothetical protein
MSYQPRGAVVRLINAMRAEPEREFTAKECADIMDCAPNGVSPMTLYARADGIIGRIKGEHGFVYRFGQYTEEELGERLANRKAEKPRNPLKLKEAPPPPWTPDPDDPRISKVVPGWKPPVMVCVRQA